MIARSASLAKTYNTAMQVGSESPLFRRWFRWVTNGRGWDFDWKFPYTILLITGKLILTLWLVTLAVSTIVLMFFMLTNLGEFFEDTDKPRWEEPNFEFPAGDEGQN